jgi:hypothetical protein
MATSLFHLNRHNESSDSIMLVDSHRSESLGLYSMALGSPIWQDKAVTFLDTALLLMYLDVSYLIKKATKNTCAYIVTKYSLLNPL